jgi:hypothetical protein
VAERGATERLVGDGRVVAGSRTIPPAEALQRPYESTIQDNIE